MAPQSAEDFSSRSLGDLVERDARTAAVFDRFGLDYCCGGRHTLDEAVKARGVPLDAVVDAIAALGEPPADEAHLADDDLDRLVARIVDEHHRYVREITPVIDGWLEQLVERHGDRHPELVDVRRTFRELSDALGPHMAKEEHLVFPFIRELVAALRSGSRLPRGPFGTIVNPIRVMESDHHLAGTRLERLRALTTGYVPPDDACTTYRRCYAELARYEADLHRHVHLENDVLFPKALALETRLS